MSRICLNITLFGGKGYQNGDGGDLTTVEGSDWNKGLISQLSLLFNTFKIPIIIFFFFFWLHRVFVAVQGFLQLRWVGLLFKVLHRPLIVVASVAEQGFYSTCSTVASHGLSCPMAGAIFQNQGQNLWLLHWQMDSYPLYHQGSPYNKHFKWNYNQ